MMQSVLLFVQKGHVQHMYSDMYDHVFRSNVRYLYYTLEMPSPLLLIPAISLH